MFLRNRLALVSLFAGAEFTCAGPRRRHTYDFGQPAPAAKGDPQR